MSGSVLPSLPDRDTEGQGDGAAAKDEGNAKCTKAFQIFYSAYNISLSLYNELMELHEDSNITFLEKVKFTH